MKERVSRLEEIVGNWSSEEAIVSAWATHVSNELDVQRDLVESHAKHVEGGIPGQEIRSSVQNGGT